MAYTKVIRSGNLIEIYEYSRTPATRYRKIQRKESPRKRFSKTTPRREDAIRRASKSFRRIVRANLVGDEAPALLTLTMYSILSVEASFRELTRFLSRCRREFGGGWRAIFVPEFQKRGAVHFHGLIWGLGHEIEKERTTRNFQRFWLRGFCDCLPTDGHPKLAGYLSKYMSKGMSDIRLNGKKAYTATRNIMRPMSVSSTSRNLEEDLDIHTLSPAHAHQFDTLWLGRCNYKAIILDVHGNKMQSIGI